MSARSILTLTLVGASLAACTLAPRYERPAPPVPQAWPTAADTTASGADWPWRDVFQDVRLQGVLQLALENNRDLRVASANIARARATYRVQRAELLPAIHADAEYQRGKTEAGAIGQAGSGRVELYSVSAGFAAWELDLFGRVRSLSTAALQSYFAEAENRRAVQVSLVGEVASTYLTLAADQELLAITRDTLASLTAALDLTRKRFDAGAASELDVRQAQTLAEQATSDLATATAQVERDRNALRLLVGSDIPADLLPTDVLADVAPVANLPAGLPSDVLTRRPDVLAAEHALKAQNADIGAARAAFFPRISLTGSIGAISPQLSSLFEDGSGAWSFQPQATLPIFAGGANLANLRGAEASRDAAVAQYEKTIQTAFREVADALATRATVENRTAAQDRLVEAAAAAERLSRARYDRGVDNYLVVLDAQRTLYAARQTRLAARLEEATNRVELYRALGGGGAGAGSP